MINRRSVPALHRACLHQRTQPEVKAPDANLRPNLLKTDMTADREHQIPPDRPQDHFGSELPPLLRADPAVPEPLVDILSCHRLYPIRLAAQTCNRITISPRVAKVRRSNRLRSSGATGISKIMRPENPSPTYDYKATIMLPNKKYYES
jgi:hypothetical protein